MEQLVKLEPGNLTSTVTTAAEGKFSDVHFTVPNVNLELRDAYSYGIFFELSFADFINSVDLTHFDFRMSPPSSADAEDEDFYYASIVSIETIISQSTLKKVKLNEANLADLATTLLVPHSENVIGSLTPPPGTSVFIRDAGRDVIDGNQEISIQFQQNIAADPLALETFMTYGGARIEFTKAFKDSTATFYDEVIPTAPSVETKFSKSNLHMSFSNAQVTNLMALIMECFMTGQFTPPTYNASDKMKYQTDLRNWLIACYDGYLKGTVTLPDGRCVPQGFASTEDDGTISVVLSLSESVVTATSTSTEVPVMIKFV
jgi:hypothetical protein